MRNNSFIINVARQGNRLPREAMDAPTTRMFQVRLDRDFSNLIQ